ncbi:MAG: hypothetical protein ABIP75_01220 [Pyrinomonadaceae bacterium]
MLLCSVLACSGGKTEAAISETRGELTVHYYKPKPGLTHGDGTPGGCTFTFKGKDFATPPMVKNGGRVFRCDLKPDTDEPTVWIAYYRPEDDWTCGTRFGEQKSKCLPDSFEAVGAILTVRNGELALQEHGFWDVSFDWGPTSINFKDGRKFDYKSWTWSGCGKDPLTYVKSGELTVSSGQFCDSEDWHRPYFAGKEFVVPDAGEGRYFDSIGINQDPEVPSATAWIGNVKGFLYVSRGKAIFKEVGNSPEFVDDGQAAQWWSEDYQTRYKMILSSEITTSQTRAEVQAALEKKNVEKDALKLERPLFTSDEYGKIEVDYQDRHGQFYLSDLKRYDIMKDTGEYPYRATSLLTTAAGEKRYFLFTMRNVTETAKVDDPCLGMFTISIVWAQTLDDLFPKNAKSQVISSCKLGRKQVGEPKIVDGKFTAAFEQSGKRFELTYDNQAPEAAFAVTK